MEDSKVCPFTKLKSSNLKKSSNSRNVNNSNKFILYNSNKTPCPIVNVLINKGELNPTREWTREEIRNVLKKNKLTSNIFSNLFVTILSKSLSVKKLQEHNNIEHDVSLSREDYHLGDHVHFSDKRFKLMYKYFKEVYWPKYGYYLGQETISLKDLIRYNYYLYKKSKKENSELTFTPKHWASMLSEMVTIFILLSENNRLDMNKLEKVFKEETLDGVKINTITTLNFSIKFIQAVNYWNFEILRSVL